MSFKDKLQDIFGSGSPPTKKPRKMKVNRIVLLLIDAENSQVDPKKMMAEVRKKYGSPRVATAYSKWIGNPQKKNSPIHKYRAAGIDCIPCDTGDNNADLMLSLDAMELIFTYHEDPNRKYLIVGAHGDRGYSHIFGKAKKFGWKTVLCTDSLEIEKNEILHSSADEILQLNEKKKKSPTKKAILKKKEGFQEIDSRTPDKGEGNTEDDIRVDIEKVMSEQTIFPPVKGFTKTASPSLKFPYQPYEFLAIIETFEELRKGSNHWTQDTADKLNEDSGIPKSRIQSVIYKLHKVLDMKVTTADINWSMIPPTLDLVSQYEESLIQSITSGDGFEHDIVPDVRKYFIEVKDLAKRKRENIPSEAVFRDSNIRNIKGFNTSIGKNRKSMQYPNEPRDALRVLFVFYSNKNKDVVWSDIRPQIEEIDGITQKRINRVYHSIGLVLKKKSEKEKIEWGKVPRMRNLITLLEQDATNNVGKKKMIGEEDRPRIHRYFELMREQLKSHSMK